MPVVLLGLIPLFASCLTQEKAGERLRPRRSVSEVRLDDIAQYAASDPVKAIHQIGVFKVLYGSGSPYPDAADPEVAEKLAAYEEEAAEKLREAQLKAVEEKRWTDAASLARSLAVLGIRVENTGEEPDFLLEYARQQLSGGNNLGAFLAAVQSHELKPLGLEDTLLFLKGAVEAKQRRTAAYFLAAADRITAEEPDRAGAVSPEFRGFAEERDTAAEMIKGVATVLVNRGYRIERGRGFPDWVLGSAFFVDAGLLITNYHVIVSEVDPAYEGYSRMYIRMGDSSSPRIPAKVLGWDKTMDLALIKAEVTPEYVFSVVDRVSPLVGDTVYAIGSPGGLEKTVTQGIVSALGRRFLQIGDVIQIDAAVNHGNSGGPVVDMLGRLVGIVFAGVEQFQGLNFAVPAERLAAALPAMIRGGKAERPWLGLSVSETPQGAEIIYTAPSTPAAEQLVKEGALIKRINGVEPRAPQGALIPLLQDLLYPARPGELAALEYTDPESNEEVRRILMTVSRPDVPLAEAAKTDSRERMTAPLFGIILTPQGGKSLFTTYLIKKVIRGSIADETGLSENDPLSIRGFRILEEPGYVLLDIDVKKRRMGYLETSMELLAPLESPDTL
jgi:S1-C subfamily serine protease